VVFWIKKGGVMALKEQQVDEKQAAASSRVMVSSLA
jgi:hypothetical protein